MDKERDYCYGILGLQPGASAAEIKTAYRNLAKFYHPDRDKSPDAEIMYREIRTAYEKLLDWHLKGKTLVLNILLINHHTLNWLLGIILFLWFFSFFFSIILLFRSGRFLYELLQQFYMGQYWLFW